MRIDHYVINLDRSPDRLAAIQADAAAAGLSLIRVPAVEGKVAMAALPRHLDAVGFRRLHGKNPLPGEYGCYASHLKAFDLVLASGAEAAVILEDDVRPGPGFDRAIRAISAVDDWDLVKLAHHRSPYLRTLRRIDGHRLGRALFGPTGSSAAYLVSRAGAARLRAHLDPMRLPFDVALERAWGAGLRILHVAPDLVAFNPATATSLTLSGASYSAQKLPALRRLPTLAFRSAELGRRLAYALKGRAR